MKKKVLVLSLLCLFFCTVSYTYSAFRNTIEGTITATTNSWNFKVSIDGATKEGAYYKVPINYTTGDTSSSSFVIVIDTTGSMYDSLVNIEIELVNLPGIQIMNISNYSIMTDDFETGGYWPRNTNSQITFPYFSENDMNGYIKVKVKGRKYNSDITVMSNGGYMNYVDGTEFWNSNYKSYIKTINFDNDLSNMPSSCTEENLCWDITGLGSRKSVYGYLVDSGEIDSNSKTLYNLYIVSEDEIYAPSYCDNIFSGFSKLTTINFNNNFNTSNVTRMGNMFYNCSSLTSLDVSNFNTSNVKSMEYMFSDCESLTSLDVSNFNTSNVTNMKRMFKGCKSLTSLEVSSFNTSNVIDMEQIFASCESLTNLDVSNFNTSNVTSMEYMFSYCKSLTNLDVSNFNTSNITNMSYMFDCCYLLTNLNLSNFNTTNVTDMRGMFNNCRALTSLDVSHFNTSNVTKMSDMFYKCYSLTSLDVSHFNTSKVTDMSSMFSSCESLTSLDVSNFNTSNVTYMGSMFSGCKSLTSLDVSNFDTSIVSYMEYMFSYCSSLTSLDVSNFNTSNVTYMNSMFQGCWKLTTLDLSNFNTTNVTNMERMFNSCQSLTTTVNIMNASVEKYSSMFSGASYISTASNAQITVNYTLDTSDLVDKMIATKSSDSNVIKRNIIYEHTITISDNTDITYQSNSTYVGALITLNSISGNNYVTSFKMNGILIESNKFTMPNTDVIITDISIVSCAIIETKHPASYGMEKLVGEYTFDGASSLTVILDYQTYGLDTNWFYIYDLSDAVTGINNNKKYGGGYRVKRIITINSNYIRIEYDTYYDMFGASYTVYGLKAIVIPNYENQE